MNGWLATGLVLLTTPAQTTTSADPIDRPAPITITALIEQSSDLAPLEVVPLGGEPPLPLEMVARSVEAHHPVLAAAEERRRQAEGTALSARGGFDPVVGVTGSIWPEGYYDVRKLEAKIEQPTPLWGMSLFGGYRIGDGRIPVYEEEIRTLNEGEIKAGVNVPLWRNGPIDERRAGIRQTEQGARAARFDRETTRLILLLEGAAAYWKWVAAGREYQIGLDLLRLAEARDQQLAAKVRQGAVAEIDRAENLRALLDRRQDLVAAQRKLEQAGIKVSLYLRSADGDPVVPPSTRLPGLPDPVPPAPNDLDTGRSAALQNRPEIDFYRAEVERAEVGVRLADNQLAPELDFQASIAKDLGTNQVEQVVKQLDPAELKLGFTLKMPFFLRKARGKFRQAEAKLAEVEQKARFQRDKIETDILNLWAAITAQSRQILLADETYRVAEAVAAAERRRFNLGATTLFIVNLREQKAAEAARKRVKARTDYALTRSAWSLATQTSLIPRS